MPQIMENTHGKTTVPAMDYESEFVNSNKQVILGNGKSVTLHVITINAPGTTWVVDVYKLTASATSVQVASINPAVQGTFGYNIYGNNGFIIGTSGVLAGNLTIVFRERE